MLMSVDIIVNLLFYENVKKRTKYNSSNVVNKKR